MDSVPDMMKSVKEADVVIVITNHKEYDFKAIIENAKFVFDSRNATGKLGKNSEKVQRL
jgi:UDP-N-acetyl-D-glucosamine dehydrogenase